MLLLLRYLESVQDVMQSFLCVPWLSLPPAVWPASQLLEYKPESWTRLGYIVLVCLQCPKEMIAEASEACVVTENVCIPYVCVHGSGQK